MNLNPATITLCLSFLLSALFLGAGFSFIGMKKKKIGYLLSTLGSFFAFGTLYLSEIYCFLMTPQNAFTGSLVILLTLLLASIWFTNEFLAILATCFAILSPFFIKIHPPESVDFVIYICLIDIGALFALLFGPWSFPILIASLFTAFYQNLFGWISNRPLLYTSSAIFFLLFLIPWMIIIPLTSSRWEKHLKKGSIVVGVSLFSFFMTLHFHLIEPFRCMIVGALASFLFLSTYFLATKEDLSKGHLAMGWVQGIAFLYATLYVLNTLMNSPLFFIFAIILSLTTLYLLKRAFSKEKNPSIVKT